MTLLTFQNDPTLVINFPRNPFNVIDSPLSRCLSHHIKLWFQRALSTRKLLYVKHQIRLFDVKNSVTFLIVLCGKSHHLALVS